MQRPASLWSRSLQRLQECHRGKLANEEWQRASVVCDRAAEQQGNQQQQQQLGSRASE
jgi:hypothetical protein